MPLASLFETIKEKNDSKQVDIKSFKDDHELRKYFKEILPDFDEDRVYTNDIKKVFNWYNLLVAAGITDFAEKEEAAEPAEEKPAE